MLYRPEMTTSSIKMFKVAFLDLCRDLTPELWGVPLAIKKQAVIAICLLVNLSVTGSP